MRLKLLALFFIVISFFLFSAQKISAEEVIKEVRLTVTDDTYISQSSPDAINGNKTSLSAKGQPQDNNFILLKFSTSQIPKGSRIGSATLLMTSYSCIGADQTPILELYDTSDDWNEETARWTGRPQLGFSLGLIDATPQIKSWNVSSKVDKWVQGTSSNNGLIVTVQGGPYACNFYSKEKTNDSINLIVQFIPPDTTKPVISQVKAVNVTLTGATITWSTDEDSMSYVDYYTTSSSNGFLPNVESAGHNDNTKAHQVALENLSAGKKYNFRVRSKDIVGNQGVSNYSTFTTKNFIIPNFALNISPIKFNTLAPTNADQQEQEASAATEEGTPSTLEISEIAVNKVTDTTAKITWKSNEQSNSWIYYSSSEEDKLDSPEFESVGIDEEVTEHEILLKDLTPNTIYDYYVASTNSGGVGAASPNYSFTTLESGANKAEDTEKSQNQSGSEKNSSADSIGKKLDSFMANYKIAQSDIIIVLFVIIMLLATSLVFILMKRKSQKDHLAKSADDEEEVAEKEPPKKSHK